MGGGAALLDVVPQGEVPPREPSMGAKFTASAQFSPELKPPWKERGKVMMNSPGPCTARTTGTPRAANRSGDTCHVVARKIHTVALKIHILPLIRYQLSLGVSIPQPTVSHPRNEPTLS